MFGGSGKVDMKIENIKSAGSIFLAAIKNPYE
jgi:hypothetical protein